VRSCESWGYMLVAKLAPLLAEEINLKKNLLEEKQ
jgi:hypothetical protein